jgi:hypothetical protein
LAPIFERLRIRAEGWLQLIEHYDIGSAISWGTWSSYVPRRFGLVSDACAEFVIALRRSCELSLGFQVS